MNKLIRDLHPPSLIIIMPCYNEEENIQYSHETLMVILNDLIAQQRLDECSGLCYVDDHSTDQSWNLIQALGKRDQRVKGVKLSANQGQQTALLAGMHSLAEEFELFLTLDIDLQDDPKAIPQMLSAMERGSKIVYGVRTKRSVDSMFKQLSARLYYYIMKFLEQGIIKNHSDFRMFDRQVLNALLDYPERLLLLRAVFPRLGFESAQVEYSRIARRHGNTKYSLFKMVSLALDGISSYSSAPLMLVFVIALTGILVSVVIFFWAFSIYLKGLAIPGWFSVLFAVLVFGAFQLFCLGLIGTYIKNIYNEVKKRPRFHITDRLNIKQLS